MAWDSSTSPSAVSQGRVRPISEALQEWTHQNWSRQIGLEVGKFCASYYDEGQATWSNPVAEEPLYTAWKMNAVFDLNPEVLGIGRFRQFVRQLPPTADAAILQMLQTLRVPPWLWEKFLLAHVYSLPGWFAYTKFQAEAQADEVAESSAFVDLLAIRLSFEAALAESLGFYVDWDSYGPFYDQKPEEAEENPDSASEQASASDVFARAALLRASELTFESRLLGQLPSSASQTDESKPVCETSTPDSGLSAASPSEGRRLAQLVFCIDVRSERLRRHFESGNADIETFGFAGFFGAPIQVAPFGEPAPRNQLPVLLQPQFTVQEGLSSGDIGETRRFSLRRRTLRKLRSLWKRFATDASSCFTFVESIGAWFAIALWRRSLGLGSRGPRAHAFDGLKPAQTPQLRPTLRGLNAQGVTTTRQAELAATILTNMGLTKNFARLIVLCGHESQSENNPLAASLDCGACGGHSGEPNARFVATLLNQNYVRQALVSLGIHIPADTHFCAAVHNTTTDAFRILDEAEVPREHLGDLQELNDAAGRASEMARRERQEEFPSSTEQDVFRRAVDWSEVRPEWGLAGNAAFLVAPRSLTKDIDLQGRAFLHSYDYHRDADGSVLELIMTAPMVVAHWINMQYFASSVDPKHFGSGSKTLHNVIGKFGLWSGEGGDLQTGLPWESVHTGTHFQHKPLRLLSIIAAPREVIDRVLQKHEFLNNLVANGWLHLLCMEEGTTYRCRQAGDWKAVVDVSTPTGTLSVRSGAKEPSDLKIAPAHLVHECQFQGLLSIS